MSAVPQIPPAPDRYAERFARVLAHIEMHPDGALSLDELSEVAAFSRFHFQRQFCAFLGMSVSRYSQFMRMRRASWRLAFRAELSVGDIALATGYESPEAFARAFRQYAGQSPSEFRAQPDWPGWHSRFKPFIHLRKEFMHKPQSPPIVRVLNFPETHVAMLTHRGSPALLGESVRKFIEWRRANSLPPRLSATFNVAWCDPDETPPDEFRFGMGAATTRPVQPNDAGMTSFVLAAGRCAVLRHVGSDDHLAQSIRHLYAVWLPGSGEELRDFPLFMQRVSFFPDVPEGDAITDIYLPLA